MVKYENHLSKSLRYLSKSFFLPLFPLDHQAQSSSDHRSGSCACSSPRNGSSGSFFSTFAFSFTFAFSSPHLGGLQTVWTAKYTRCRPMSKKKKKKKPRSFIINVTLLAGYCICGPLSKFVFSIIIYDEGSVRAAAVSFSPRS